MIRSKALAAFVCLAWFSLSPLATRALSQSVAGAVPATTPANPSQAALDRVRFQGNRVCTDDVLREGLRWDLDSVLAFASGEITEDGVKRIGDRLMLGYQHSGFPRAKVSARVEGADRQLLLTIEEGPRVVCGEVRVIGALKSLQAGALARALAARLGPGPGTNAVPAELKNLEQGLSDAPPARQGIAWPSELMQIGTNRVPLPETPLGLWVEDAPAPTDPAARVVYARTMTNVMSGFGHFQPRFAIDWVPREGTLQSLPASPGGPPWAKVDLVIRVEDEGPDCRLGAIEVVGLQRNTQAEFLAGTGLEPGRRMTLELLRSNHERWMDSGRFLNVLVEPGNPDAEGKAPVRITVREHQDAPRLSEPFTRLDEALLRFRGWLLGWRLGNEDAVLHVEAGTTNAAPRSGPSADLIVSPRAGVLFRAFQESGRAESLRALVMLTTNQSTLLNGGRRQSFVTEQTPGQLMVHLAMGVGQDGQGDLTLAGGVKNATSGPPFRLDLDLSTAGFLRLARLPERIPGWKWSERDGILIGGTGETTLRIDAATGRLLEFQMGNTGLPISTNQGTWERMLDGGFRLELQSNALARAISEAGPALTQATNRYDASNGLGSFMAFAIDAAWELGILELLENHPAPARLLAAGATISKHLDETLFDGLQAAMLGAAVTSEIGFMIPLPIDGDGQPGTSSGFDPLVARILGSADRMVVAGTWPNVLVREKALGFSSRANLAGQGWQSLYESPDTGPLACLVAAKQVRGQAAQAMALKGLTALSAEAFRRDLTCLLDGDTGAAVLVRRLLTRWSELGSAEMESLLGLFAEPDREAVMAGLEVLRAGGSPPLTVRLRPVLDRWWEGSMRARFTAALRRAWREAQPGN